MHSVRSNNLSLKYQMVTPSGCKDIVMRKFVFGIVNESVLMLKEFCTHPEVRMLIGSPKVRIRCVLIEDILGLSGEWGVCT